MLFVRIFWCCVLAYRCCSIVVLRIIGDDSIRVLWLERYRSSGEENAPWWRLEFDTNSLKWRMPSNEEKLTQMLEWNWWESMRWGVDQESLGSVFYSCALARILVRGRSAVHVELENEKRLNWIVRTRTGKGWKRFNGEEESGEAETITNACWQFSSAFKKRVQSNVDVCDCSVPDDCTVHGKGDSVAAISSSVVCANDDDKKHLDAHSAGTAQCCGLSSVPRNSSDDSEPGSPHKKTSKSLPRPPSSSDEEYQQDTGDEADDSDDALESSDERKAVGQRVKDSSMEKNAGRAKIKTSSSARKPVTSVKRAKRLRGAGTTTIQASSAPDHETSSALQRRAKCSTPPTRMHQAERRRVSNTHPIEASDDDNTPLLEVAHRVRSVATVRAASLAKKMRASRTSTQKGKQDSDDDDNTPLLEGARRSCTAAPATTVSLSSKLATRLQMRAKRSRGANTQENRDGLSQLRNTRSKRHKA